MFFVVVVVCLFFHTIFRYDFEVHKPKVTLWIVMVFFISYHISEKFVHFTIYRISHAAGRLTVSIVSSPEPKAHR